MTRRRVVHLLFRTIKLRFLFAFYFLVCCLASPSFADAGPESGLLKDIPLDEAIRIGTGSKAVIEISDPDCRFSRRMARYWDMRKDVTRYIFLIALKNHPEAAQKVRYILCASDKAAAYREAFSGGLDFGENLDGQCNDHGLPDKHGKMAAKLGVIGTPTYFVRGVRVDGAKVKEIERILGGEKFPFDAGDPE